MIAIIKGDIIASRTLSSPEPWLHPLKSLLATWGQTPQEWELAWGDAFQLEIQNPELALHRALHIKALIKKTGANKDQPGAGIDIRLSIGIGEKTYQGSRVSESNGPAYVRAGEKFDLLRREHSIFGLESPWPDFDEEMNLLFRLASLFMDEWSVSSAALMKLVLEHPESTQQELGRMLGIKQNSVSGRWKRACVSEVLAMEAFYRKRLKRLMQ